MTPALRDFCASIAPGTPVFIPSVPMRRGRASFCFDNVAERVREKGGEIAYGWAIWHIPGLYFEAEHHGVWRNMLGNLIDVSPQLGGRTRILFLEDPAAVYDAFAPRPNVQGADGDSPRAREVAELGNRRHALMTRCRIPGTAQIELYETDQLELTEIDARLLALLSG